MCKGCYVIYDTVAKECAVPFYANNESHARMQFDMAMEKAQEAGFKQEFKLLKLADIDLDTGSLIPACDCSKLYKPVDVTFVLKAEDDE